MRCQQIIFYANVNAKLASTIVRVVRRSSTALGVLSTEYRRIGELHDPRIEIVVLEAWYDNTMKVLISKYEMRAIDEWPD